MTAAAAAGLLGWLRRADERLGVGDVNPITDLHAFDVLLVLDLARNGPAIGGLHRNGWYSRVDGLDRDRSRLPGDDAGARLVFGAARSNGVGRVVRGLAGLPDLEDE